MEQPQRLNCLIVDDQAFAIRILENHLAHFPEFKLVYAGSDVFEALRLLTECNIDLVFLDIQMPDMSGLQFLKLSRSRARFIFTTAYPKYAFEGYENDITDFLLKPIIFARFQKAIGKFKQQVQVELQQNTAASKDHVLIKGDAKQKYHKVQLVDILYVKGLDNYISISTTTGVIVTYMNLKDLTALLPAHRFCRIHKSYIVSLEHIAYVEKNSVRIRDDFFPIGPAFKKDFFRRWDLRR
ncbi:LytR/AlgR family response regulator transcription factor [Sphingobacterium thalpophilum]|uniref:Probable transcriptional regulatory protein YehT n=1 Tax=Sphingobacterium thalpophilum TaxID=259 RepID=A0A4V6KTM5_9SPHI|nr:LytTR family DNA-binding domain-containing protein [Sphingobacterium thalpophilum]VTR51618.1 Probable transcriptional regulatory protein YehT [Sphingobacterium thalpophilum]